jgi:hypothetical protein
VRAICWIVPKKYLLLLDQTIFLHFRSSIDRPLNPLPPYPCSIYLLTGYEGIASSLSPRLWLLTEAKDKNVHETIFRFIMQFSDKRCVILLVFIILRWSFNYEFNVFRYNKILIDYVFGFASVNSQCLGDNTLAILSYPVNKYILFQYPGRKYIINNWGLMNFFYFGWSGVYFIFILHLYITVTCRHTIVFYGKDCFSNIKTSSKRLEYLNIFPSFFKKFNTSWNQKNTLTVFVFYLF